MALKDPSKRILNIPNGVSFVRLLGVGVFWWVLIHDDNVALAAWLIFGIGWTDWIDGYLARRLDQVTDLGKLLDPIADRLMIASAVVGGMVVDALPLWFGSLLIVRELVMASLAAWLAGRGGGSLDVRYLGKLATFLLYGSIPAFYLAHADVAPTMTRPMAWVSGLIGLALYWYVAFEYFQDARRRMAELESNITSQEV